MFPEQETWQSEASPRSSPGEGGGQVNAPAEVKSHSLRLEGPDPDGSGPVRVLCEKERVLRSASWLREGGMGPARERTRKRSDAFRSWTSTRKTDQ